MSSMERKVAMMDLKRQFEPVMPEIKEKISNLLDNQSFILGPDLKRFEENIAKYCQAAYAVGLNSGTDALFLALRALGIGPGDEVITTPFTFIATVEAIASIGAKPVFVDIEQDGFTLDPDKIEKAITKKTKAILPVHIFGQCSKMEDIMNIARAHGLKVVEDVAQAIAATRNGKVAGTFGDIGTLSFYPGKNLGGVGDGGGIITNDAKLAEYIALVRNHGSSNKQKYLHIELGFNSRLDNIQAAVLDIKLRHLGQWIKNRIENAKFYDEGLKGLPLSTPKVLKGNVHTYHLYTIKLNDRDALIEYLVASGIEARAYYHVPMHLQPSLKYLGYKKGDLPVAEETSETTMSIPMHENLSHDEREYVVSKIKLMYR